MIRVYADGRVEDVPPESWAGGLYEIRHDECPHCGTKMAKRVFESHFAEDQNTFTGEGVYRGAQPANGGTIVLIERRDTK